jgi:hypothetical protein
MPLDIKTIKEILSIDYSQTGPLAQVEDLIIPEPIEITPKAKNNLGMKSTRGRRSGEEWLAEIRKVWRYINEEDKLGESWLSRLPQVQDLAESKHSGRLVGRGLALQELLMEAITEARKCTTDKKIQEILLKYPSVKMKDIAGNFGLKSREHFSRLYGRKAAVLIVRAFQLLLSQPIVKK